MSVGKRISIAALPLLLLVVLGVSACGGSSDSRERGTLSLIAYSTPQEAYEEIIPAFRKTAGARASASSSPTAPPVTRPARSRRV